MTGGGTAGHVTPNIALFPYLKENGFDIIYVGSYEGIEKKLVSEQGIAYEGISSGKLRRYFSLKNFTDPFRVLKGFGEAKKLMKKHKPDVVFSKGGFVSVPVVFAAKKYNIPVIIHESDITPGLANKLSIPKATKVCCNFPETLQYLPNEKAVLTGCPIRDELLSGNKLAGLDFCKFSSNKPILLVIGGSLGALAVNKMIREALPSITERFQVVHLCGKGKLDESYIDFPNYIQFEYINEELKDIFAMADIVVSRAGANAICEIQALCKPNILIPLPASSSRGDQCLNAASFEKQGFSVVLEEEKLTPSALVDNINKLYDNRNTYIDAMKSSNQNSAISTIIGLINELS